MTRIDYSIPPGCWRLYRSDGTYLSLYESAYCYEGQPTRSTVKDSWYVSSADLNKGADHLTALLLSNCLEPNAGPQELWEL